MIFFQNTNKIPLSELVVSLETAAAILKFNHTNKDIVDILRENGIHATLDGEDIVYDELRESQVANAIKEISMIIVGKNSYTLTGTPTFELSVVDWIKQSLNIEGYHVISFMAKDIGLGEKVVKWDEWVTVK